MVCGKILENFKRWKGSDQAAEWILGHTLTVTFTFSSASTTVLSSQRDNGSSVDFSVHATN